MELKGVTGSVGIRMGAGNDVVHVDGQAGSLVITGKLKTLEGARDTMWLDRLTTRATGSKNHNNDLVAIVDAVLESGLTVRLSGGADEFVVCRSTLHGALRLGTGGGSDSVTIDDSEFYGKTAIETGPGADVVNLERQGNADGPATVFHGPVKLRTRRGNDRVAIGKAGQGGNSAQFHGKVKLVGGRARDVLDAGLGGKPNSYGNALSSPPQVRGFEVRS